MLSEYSVENTSRVLEDLNIDPQNFSAALGRDIFSQVDECQDHGGDSTSDSSDTSDTSHAEQRGKLGGICPSKMDLCVGIALCRECFSVNFEGECSAGADSVGLEAESPDLPIVTQQARSASETSADRESVENWFPSSRSGSADNFEFDESKSIILYEDFEDSDGDYESLQPLESCDSLESVPDMSEDNLHPECQYDTRHFGDRKLKCKTFVQEQPVRRSKACCNQNNGNSDEHDVTCEGVNYHGYPRHWNLGITSVAMGLPGLGRIGEESSDCSDSDSDSEITFLSNPGRVIVNVRSSPCDQDQEVIPRGLFFSIGPLEDNRLDSEGESFESLSSELLETEEEICFPM